MTFPPVPNRLSAFLAGFGLGLIGVAYEFCSHAFAWNNEQRDLYFMPLAVFGFVLPMFLFVAGPPYFQQRPWPEWLQFGGRMAIWFVGAVLATFVGGGLGVLFAG